MMDLRYTVTMESVEPSKKCNILRQYNGECLALSAQFEWVLSRGLLDPAGYIRPRCAQG